jgi:hypothetical protein
MKQDVNYILHHKNVNIKMMEDTELTPIHLSLYNALFLLWNRCEYDSQLSINRNDVMKLSKIGNANTYTNSLKALDKGGYIKYIPSFNPLKGSIVTIIRCDKGSDTGGGKSSDIGSGKGGDTLYKQYNNLTIEQKNIILSHFNSLEESELEKEISLLSVKKELFDDSEAPLKFTFEMFWKKYPKKSNRKKAVDKWNSIPSKQILEIERTLDAFIEYKPFDGYNHPDASTYLHNKRWLDELPNQQKQEQLKRDNSAW